MRTPATRWRYRMLFPAWIALLQAFLGRRRPVPEGRQAPRPFFLFGSGRNGSTLLASLLNNHPSLFIPPEQYVLPYALMKWEVMRWWSWERFVRDTLAHLARPGATQGWKLDLGSVETDLVRMTGTRRHPAYMFDRLYTAYGRMHRAGSFTWGDNTPIMAHFVTAIADAYPHGRFVLLVRDPRDVVLSYRGMPDHPASRHEFAIWKWKDSIACFDRLRIRYPHVAAYDLRYEDFVHDPGKRLRSLLEFLDESWRADMLRSGGDWADVLGAEGRAHHANLARRISARSVGKWKKELPASVRIEVERTCGAEMSRFGYEL